jgi:hypothetical protein
MNHNSTAFRRPASAKKITQGARQYNKLKAKKPRLGYKHGSYYNLIQIQSSAFPDIPLTINHIRALGISESALDANANRPDLGIVLKPRLITASQRDKLRKLSDMCGLGLYL